MTDVSVHASSGDVFADLNVQRPAGVPDADGWIEWKGGECPVPENTFVDLELKSGEVVSCDRAGTFIWSHPASVPSLDDEIVRYRIVTPAPSADPVRAALVEALEALTDAVFGNDRNDEPNVYADYDAAIALAHKCNAALALARGEGKP